MFENPSRFKVVKIVSSVLRDLDRNFASRIPATYIQTNAKKFATQSIADNTLESRNNTAMAIGMQARGQIVAAASGLATDRRMPNVSSIARITNW